MAKQFGFAGAGFERTDCFGGSLLKGNARGKRPLHTRLPIHVVLRAQTTTATSMRNPHKFVAINRTITNLARKYGITLYDYANAGNHIHLLIKIPSRTLYSFFIRALSGRLAQIAQGLNGQAKGAKYWIVKPYTRVIRSWRKAFRSVKEYVHLNTLEAEGVVTRHEMAAYRELRKLWADPVPP